MLCQVWTRLAQGTRLEQLCSGDGLACCFGWLYWKDSASDPPSRRQMGHIAMMLGFLFALSQASEADAWPMQLSASVVLIHMVAGFVLGWLAQPLLARIFTNS